MEPQMEPQMEPKNLLFIMSDQHGPSFMGCSGHPMVKTPNLDRLAARGTRFENAYTNCPICVPARASFATGSGDNAFIGDASKVMLRHLTPDLLNGSIPESVWRRTSICWINFPGNPTGAVAPPEFFARAAELARSRRSDALTLSRRLSGDLDLITGNYNAADKLYQIGRASCRERV